MGTGRLKKCTLPRAGLAQSLYCWGLHTGEFPRIGRKDRSGPGARERPLGYPRSLLPAEATQSLTGHMHHSTSALPRHIAGLTSQATPY